jgi:hypothetical protein
MTEHLTVRNVGGGKSWRGNLIDTIHDSPNQKNFIKALCVLCKTEYLGGDVTFPIDTPSDFSQCFRNSLSCKIGDYHMVSALTTYLYRYTQRFLAEWGYTQLSMLKDMISSQATKSVHILSKFTPHRIQSLLC